MTRRKFSDAELAAFPVSKQKAIQRQRRHVERKAKQQSKATETEHARNATAPGGLLPDQRLDAVESDVMDALNGDEAQIFRLTKDELEAVGKWRPSLRFIAATYCRATAVLLIHNGAPSASLIAQQLAAARMLGLDELPTAKKRAPVSDRFKF